MATDFPCRFISYVHARYLYPFAAGVRWGVCQLVSQQGLPAHYMQTTEDAAIWAQVGNDVVNVGNVRAGQILAVFPAAADYYEFRFGFGTGFIDKAHLENVQGKQRVEDSLGDLNKPLSNQNLITWKDTPVYNAPQ